MEWLVTKAHMNLQHHTEHGEAKAEPHDRGVCVQLQIMCGKCSSYRKQQTSTVVCARLHHSLTE